MAPALPTPQHSPLSASGSETPTSSATDNTLRMWEDEIIESQSLALLQKPAGQPPLDPVLVIIIENDIRLRQRLDIVEELVNEIESGFVEMKAQVNDMQARVNAMQAQVNDLRAQLEDDLRHRWDLEREIEVFIVWAWTSGVSVVETVTKSPMWEKYSPVWLLYAL